MGRSPYIWVQDEARAWHGIPKAAPVVAWSAQNSEAQIAAMQRQGPDPEARGGFAAYADWLKLMNPETPRRD